MLFAKGKKIGFQYPGACESALRDVDFSLSAEDIVGITGLNGSGKSTLARMVKGELSPTQGDIWRLPGIRVIQVHQQGIPGEEEWQKLPGEALFWSSDRELYRAWKQTWLIMAGETSMPDHPAVADAGDAFENFDMAGGYRIMGAMGSCLSRWGIDEQELERPCASLSGGEMTRIRMAGATALLEKARGGQGIILILDEPTNHLDIRGRELTTSWLNEITGSREGFAQDCGRPELAALVISHDRDLLDNVCNCIWNMERGALRQWRGNYSEARKLQEDEAQRIRQDNQQRRQAIGSLTQAATARRQIDQGMENFKLPRSITKTGRVCKRDDGAGQSKRRTGMMASALALEKRVERLRDSMEEEVRQPRKYRLGRHLQGEIQRGTALRVRDLAMGFAHRCLFRDLTMDLPWGSVLALVGPNGSGKSTLLSILTGQLQPLQGTVDWSPRAKLAHISQDLPVQGYRGSVLQAMDCQEQGRQEALRGLLGAFRLQGDKALSPMDQFSPGQARKAWLAGLMASGATVLILDEPENHMEIIALEALEEALAHFPGTVVMATHDQALVRRLATHCINLMENQVSIYCQEVNCVG